jgi:hypothetical protein
MVKAAPFRGKVSGSHLERGTDAGVFRSVYAALFGAAPAVVFVGM